MKFRKYEFDSKEQFEELKLQNNITGFNGTFTELGILREDKYSVDVLWNQQPPEDFKSYEIWDIQGNGSHTFLGWDFNPEEQNQLFKQTKQ
jgi:hypothetical protein